MTIAVAERSYSRGEISSILHPLVAEWFSNFSDLTPPQRYAIVNIHKGRNTLIASPTGSGKTLSAFLSIISELVRLGEENSLNDAVYCIYISPLRSLNNDIYKKPAGASGSCQAPCRKEEHNFAGNSRWSPHWRHSAKRKDKDAPKASSYSYHDARKHGDNALRAKV